MLPSLVVFIFIAFLINNLINIKNFYSHNKTLKLICNTSIFLIILSNICGGYFRSNEHIKAMNVYSTRIIYFDAMSIYDESFKHIKIEKIEYDKKIKHLKNLNINNWNDVENLDKNTNSKIYIANFSPLEF
jgi:hypothetical protein